MDETVAEHPGDEPARGRWVRTLLMLLVAAVALTAWGLHVKQIGMLIDENDAPEINGGDVQWIKECKYLYAFGVKDTFIGGQQDDYAAVDSEKCSKVMPK